MDLTRKENRARIGQRMAELRKLNRYRQRDCAEALGVAQPTYAGMEYGEGAIRRRDLVTLAVLYEMDPEEAFPEFFGSGQEAA